jgi:threonine dehydrogenase-like Zn-dependent dehydrogenase
VLRHNLFELKWGAGEGIDAASKVSLTLANADAAFSQLSANTGFKGALLTGTTGNSLALFGAGAVGQVVTGDITFSQPAGPSKVVIGDLTPNAGYAVTTVASGSNYNVTVRPGTGFTTSEYGTLYLNVDAAGVATAGN